MGISSQEYDSLKYSSRYEVCLQEEDTLDNLDVEVLEVMDFNSVLFLMKNTYHLRFDVINRIFWAILGGEAINLRDYTSDRSGLNCFIEQSVR